MKVGCVAGLIVLGMGVLHVQGGEPALSIAPTPLNTAPGVVVPAVVAPPVSGTEMKTSPAAGIFQRRLEHVKKQISDRQLATEKLSQMLADKRNEDARPLLERQVEFGRKQLGLLQELQAALEKQDQVQVDKVFMRLQEVSTAWSAFGEVEARLEADRARAKKLVEENAGAEVKAAWDAYSAASAAMLEALERKQALEKDIRDLDAKQREALQKLRLEAQAASKKSKDGTR